MCELAACDALERCGHQVAIFDLAEVKLELLWVGLRSFDEVLFAVDLVAESLLEEGNDCLAADVTRLLV